VDVKTPRRRPTLTDPFGSAVSTRATLLASNAPKVAATGLGRRNVLVGRVVAGELDARLRELRGHQLGAGEGACKSMNRIRK